MMELTMSSLRKYQDVEIGIMNAITHGGSSIIANGFTRLAMMYLYTRWDIS